MMNRIREIVCPTPQTDVHAIMAEAIRLQRFGRHEEAEATFRRAVACEPDNARACQLLGAALHRYGRTDEGLSLLCHCVELEPRSAAFRCNLGAALGMLGRHDEAAHQLREAVRLSPGTAQAHNNLGVALEHLERYAEAADSLREAVRLAPADARAWANLSNTLRKGWRPDEALAAADRAIAADPAYAEAHNARGAALLDLDCLDEAWKAFAQTTTLQPSHAEARVNAAMTLQTRGDWIAGFRAFECRFDHPVWRRRLPGRRWVAPAVGSDATAAPALPAGSTVLLYGEGGLGNAIQFARFASRVADMGARVVIECRPELAPLLRTVPGVSAVIGQGEPLPAYDCYAALMSLPALLGVDQANAAADGPYLSADPERVAKWGALLKPPSAAHASQPKPLLVGVCWQGEQTPAFRRNRSFPAEQLGSLARVPGVRLVSLQKGCGFDGSFPMTELPELDEQGGAFLDTAAVMMHLDLVVTCDTSIAHLAGALARPTWVAVPFAADWRWLREGRSDTPWYPTMRLFRQPAPGDWAATFGQMALALT